MGNVEPRTVGVWALGWQEHRAPCGSYVGARTMLQPHATAGSPLQGSQWPDPTLCGHMHLLGLSQEWQEPCAGLTWPCSLS